MEHAPSAADRAALQHAWTDKLAAAEAMVPLIGRLYRRDDVVPSVYGRPLVGESPIGIVKAHRSTRRVDETELPVSESLAILTELDTMDVTSASVDLADLAARHRADPLGTPLREFLEDELFLARGSSGDAARPAPRDVVLYGFGRIGRMLARILLERAGEHAPLVLRAVVVRRRGPDDLVKRASLLRRDSIHGPFAGTVTVDTEHDTITANGTLVQFISADAPSAVDYRAHGIEDAIVVDTTGRWRDAEGLEQHLLAPGAGRVLLTAPGTGDLPNVVHGINHDAIGDAPVVSAASCTTNAIVPVLKAVSDAYGVVHGHVETVHSATNDQNLVDNYHPADRRGRAAGLNMVITATGAARAAEKALPELRGRLTGNAVRVPTPNVSLAVLHLTLARAVGRDELNGLLRDASLTSSLRRQIDYVESPEVVSTDFLGSRRAGVVDGLATIADGSEHVVLYVWYDNESGYSRQVHRILQEMAGGRATALPATPVGRRAAVRHVGGSLQTCGTSERSGSTWTAPSSTTAERPEPVRPGS
ncbi:glyceraldehyde-3-phosphate dehydrogenase [Curtobacterium sp. MCBA15_004]|uniref:glyceraldehyde-3-phosphate dehydrogenase n=1 Tax=unclassified Curtobacterium TaxID=257496 RepID=UPI0008DE50B5|nr:glyceraldehyde-3-phosphate dehydrogenase [Curtobacterium sp. MCBA15_004]WIA96272.1 glyceraldehyde-3-phosphate dehydrogenase [Curtobacterium sp. MCBA15_004]